MKIIDRIFNRTFSRVLAKLIDKKLAEFNRFLPLGDYFIDRWTKAARLGFGTGTSVYDSAIVLGDVRVGRDCWIGPFTILDGSGAPLVVGDCCDISAGTHIYTHDTAYKVTRGERLRRGPVTIGEHTYIGPNCVVVAGTRIGDHAVVGACSFVSTDIPSFSKAWGVPARVVESDGRAP